MGVSTPGWKRAIGGICLFYRVWAGGLDLTRSGIPGRGMDDDPPDRQQFVSKTGRPAMS